MEYVISRRKITNYLLTNPKKRGFFLGVGYSIENWGQLRDDLLYIANNFPNVFRRNTPHGDEYEVIGEVQAPNGGMIKLQTGWMVRENEAGIMSFVTAYPA